MSVRDSLLPAFLAGSVAGAFAAYVALQATTKRPQAAENDRNNQQQQPSPPSAPHMMDNLLEDEILTEQFTRNVQFFGKEGQLKVAKSFVVVIGLGVWN